MARFRLIEPDELCSICVSPFWVRRVDCRQSGKRKSETRRSPISILVEGVGFEPTTSGL